MKIPRTAARVSPLLAAFVIGSISPTANAITSESILFSFSGPNGAGPVGGLVADGNGAYYGITNNGGSTYVGLDNQGFGTVFKLTPSGNGGFTESVIHSFLGGPYNTTTANTDGGLPAPLLLRNPKTGALYGVTTIGGTGTCQYSAWSATANFGCGTVFQLTPPKGNQTQWTYTIIYNFTGDTNGAWPTGGLVADANGNLYGTTYYGGNSSCSFPNPLSVPAGCGTVFKLTPPSKSGNTTTTWNMTLLHTFSGGANDGAGPGRFAALSLDASGNLYGVTSAGGVNALGTVAVLSPPTSGQGQWTQTLLHSFAGGTTDGATPEAGLHFDSSGAIYGTTTSGGENNEGAAYVITPPSASTSCSTSNSWTESLIHSFQGSNGSLPFSGLVADQNGALYGTTLRGGSTDSDGTVFKLGTSFTGGWVENTLYSFTGTQTDDGRLALSIITIDATGALYGTTGSGGLNDLGAVFKIVP